MSDQTIFFSRRFVTVLCSLMCLSLGVLASEGFLRVLQPYAIYYSTWFDPGIHQPDDELGFVFSPNFQGGMRNTDRAWYVPLHLDERGLRPPVSTRNDEQGDDIVLFGGASMGFSYGLTSSESIAAQIASQSQRPVTVHTLPWPGFGIWRDFRKYKRFIEPTQSPRIAVLFLYRDRDYEDIQAEFTDELPVPELGDDLFRYHDRLVITADGRFPRLAGRVYSESYVAAGICRELNEAESAYRWLSRRARFYLVEGGKRKQIAPRPSSEQIAEKADQVNANDTLQSEQQHDVNLITQIRNRLASRGTELVVVALPANFNRLRGPEDVSPFIPPGTAFYDLRGVLRDTDADWKARNHYGTRSARRLGEEIARLLQPHLEEPHLEQE